MTQTTADFELGTNGNDILTSDPGSATAWDARNLPGGGSFKYDNTHVYGAMAAKVITPANGAECNMEWSTALGGPTDHYGRLYLWMDALPTGDDLRLLSGAGVCWLFTIRTSGVVRALDAGGGR